MQALPMQQAALQQLAAVGPALRDRRSQDQPGDLGLARHRARKPRPREKRQILGRIHEQQLLAVDGRAARRVLRELLQHAAALPQDAAVPCAEGLSVGQLGRAVALLLDRGDRA